jgi:hypothetical protein
MAINAEFRQLIELLGSISHLETEQEQLAAIELRLVSAELNPDCRDIVELTHALGVLSKIGATGRASANTPEHLEVYF